MNKLRKILDILFSKEKKENRMDVVESSLSFGGSGLDETYLFDFKNYGSQYNANGNGFFGIGNSVTFFNSSSEPQMDGGIESFDQVENKKIPIKPIDALLELETVPTPFSLAGIVEKIEMLKHKEALITQKYAKREVSALMERLENRKKYTKYKEFFEGFQNTTDEKIDVLLKKYDHLTMNTSDIFIPEFPDEAIDIMVKYTDHMKKICDKKPVFYVIAPKDLFKKVDGKRDPILLVQSPFGFFWQILGAWDEEMLILGEL
jgi:hypothetical protein